MDVELTNTTTTPITDIYYVRTFDPDNATGNNSSSPCLNAYGSNNEVISQIGDPAGSSLALVTSVFSSGGAGVFTLI